MMYSAYKLNKQGGNIQPCIYTIYFIGIKIDGRKINNLTYADNITLWQKEKN